MFSSMGTLTASSARGKRRVQPTAQVSVAAGGTAVVAKNIAGFTVSGYDIWRVTNPVDTYTAGAYASNTSVNLSPAQVNFSVTVENGPLDCYVLLMGGGGGGACGTGGTSAQGGGGGGAGQLLHQKITLPTGNHTIALTIGAGGRGAGYSSGRDVQESTSSVGGTNGFGYNGGETRLEIRLNGGATATTTLTAKGGGGGAPPYSSNTLTTGANGGGAGSTRFWDPVSLPGAAGSGSGSGYTGGSVPGSHRTAAGGGAGCGGNGGDGAAGTPANVRAGPSGRGGAGGTGINPSLVPGNYPGANVNQWFGGGGGGAICFNATISYPGDIAGVGGSGVGGKGCGVSTDDLPAAEGTNAIRDTGSGGGGGHSYVAYGGCGSNGFVLFSVNKTSVKS